MDLVLFLGVMAVSSIIMTALQPRRVIITNRPTAVPLKKITHKIIIIVAAIIPALLVGLRDISVGSDTDGTAYMFFLKYVQGKEIPAELFYWIVAKIGYWVFGNYNGMLFSVALVTLLFAYFAIGEYRFSFHPGLATFIYLLMLLAPMCNIVRQSMAIAICLFNAKNVHEKKLRRFLLFTVLAGFAHVSAFLMVVIYPLYHIAINTKLVWLRLLVVVLSFSSPFWITYVYQLLCSLSLFSDYTKYMNMFGQRDIAVYNFVIRYGIYFLILFSLLRVVWKSGYKELLEFSKTNIFFFYPILEAMGILCTGNMKWAFRIMYYFTPGYAMLCPYLERNFKSKYRIFYSIALISVFVYYFVVYHYLWKNDAVFPYMACF